MRHSALINWAYPLKDCEVSEWNVYIFDELICYTLGQWVSKLLKWCATKYTRPNLVITVAEHGPTASSVAGTVLIKTLRMIFSKFYKLLMHSEIVFYPEVIIEHSPRDLVWYHGTFSVHRPWENSRSTYSQLDGEGPSRRDSPCLPRYRGT